ncbi:MAG TPA: nicotinate-nucleotide adenylyltransferase [Candidatus Cloacimonadota bacterium]|nr:nicotinate-nucleotide adenylyltransferase [Candidatus Cloacimonadota bacterium]
MKIGILGGSFDPLHFGHLALAETALKALKLDKILFLPSGNHPFKKNITVLPAAQRLELVEKCLTAFPAFEASGLDMEDENTSYTADLIRKLRTIYPDDELFFICGDDVVTELPYWHEWKWLLENVHFVVAQRPSTDRDNWQHLDYLEFITFIQMKPHDISSTDIREKVKKGESIQGLVPPQIESEIISLYR